MTGHLLPEDLDRRLAAELVPIRPAPPRPAPAAELHRHPVTQVSAEQAAHNRAVLLAALERRAA